MRVAVSDSPAACDDIPLPIVSLNRWTLLVGIVAGFVLQQPLFTTLLFLILLPAVLIGQRASLIQSHACWQDCSRVDVRFRSGITRPPRFTTSSCSVSVSWRKCVKMRSQSGRGTR